MKSKNILTSFKYAFIGIISAFKSERNLRIHILSAIIVIILGLYFKLSILKWMTLFITISLVIGAELINTALEELVNLITLEKNIHAKKVKDIAAGFVLIFALCSILIAIFIFVPEFYNLFISNIIYF